jgi:hypothetical protein
MTELFPLLFDTFKVLGIKITMRCDVMLCILVLGLRRCGETCLHYEVWRWRHQFSPKFRDLSVCIHGVLCQEMNLKIVLTEPCSNL